MINFHHSKTSLSMLWIFMALEKFPIHLCINDNFHRVYIFSSHCWINSHQSDEFSSKRWILTKKMNTHQCDEFSSKWQIFIKVLNEFLLKSWMFINLMHFHQNDEGFIKVIHFPERDESYQYDTFSSKWWIIID